jgi:hypothetical protein
MATQNRTGTPQSYLGHPCKLAPLIEHRSEEPEFARLKTNDTRHLVQRLGEALATNETRVANALTLTERLATMAEEGADHAEIKSMADVLRDYLLHSSNHAFDATTLALAALHTADLIAPSQRQSREASHA